MYMLFAVFTLAGVFLLVGAVLPHGRGLIPLHPVIGRLAGLFFLLAAVFRVFRVVFHRTISDNMTFVILASIGLFLLLLGLLFYKIPRRF